MEAMTLPVGEIVCGDCLDVLRGWPDGCVDCCITSPPYYGLRCYIDADSPEKPFEIGLEPTPAEYIARIVAVFAEVRRVLKPTGTLFINLGDSYYGSGKGQNGDGSASDRKGAKQGTSAGTLTGGLPVLRAGGQHADVCGTSGTTPGDSLGHGCLCENLCDACRAAYLIGKSHSGFPPDPTQSLLPCAPSREHMESAPVHLPTSDSSFQAGRNSSAIPDSEQPISPAGAPLPASPVSTRDESSQQHQVGCSPMDRDFSCRLCGRTLRRNAQESDHRADCICGNTPSDHPSVRHIADTVSWHTAYPDYTTKSPVLKQKDLLMMPARVALALQADGWYLRSDIIWAKPNPMPESVTDRPTKAHEYIYLLSKSARYYYDAAAIAEPVSGEQSERALSFCRETKEADMPGQSCRQHRGNRKTFRGGGAYTAGNSFDNGALKPNDVPGNAPNPTGLRNARTVWTMQEPQVRLRDDLSDGDRAYVLGELLRRGL